MIPVVRKKRTLYEMFVIIFSGNIFLYCFHTGYYSLRQPKTLTHTTHSEKLHPQFISSQNFYGHKRRLKRRQLKKKMKTTKEKEKGGLPLLPWKRKRESVFIFDYHFNGETSHFLTHRLSVNPLYAHCADNAVCQKFRPPRAILFRRQGKLHAYFIFRALCRNFSRVMPCRIFFVRSMQHFILHPENIQYAPSVMCPSLSTRSASGTSGLMAF